MAFFGVTRELIGKIYPIEGADRIEMATLQGMDFQFVVAKGEFAPGDSCLYFPVDSILPEALAVKMGLAGKLSGKNRVKTVRLRGQISQGVVSKPTLVPSELRTPEEITNFLGVVKYEPPETLEKDARLTELPREVPYYDIEGADRYPSVVELLMDQPVSITEKLEGSNFSVCVTASGEVAVCSHRKSIIPVEGVEHTWWKVARESGVIDFARKLWELNAKVSEVVVYGEVVGPSLQSNIYRLSRHELYIFDIRIAGRWVSSTEFVTLVANYASDTLKTVPVLASGITLRTWLNGKTAQEASNGTSLLFKTRREGVVIKPETEAYIQDFGRLLIKQRSPEYLARSDS